MSSSDAASSPSKLARTVLGGPESRTVLGGPSSQSATPSSSNSTTNVSTTSRPPKKRKSKRDYSKSSVVIKTTRLHPELGSSDEEEEEQDYKRGGYHPVQIGHVYNNRFKIISKLGWGHFSTVWLATDSETQKTVALKIVKSASRYSEVARDEIALLQKVTENDKEDSHCVVHLVNTFEHNGPNGRHVCIVFEHLGCNLLSVVRLYKSQGLPLPLVKIFTKQLLIALDYLHTDCSIIHTDLKPENVLLLVNPNLLPPGIPQPLESATVSNNSIDKSTPHEAQKEGNSSTSNNVTGPKDPPVPESPRSESSSTIGTPREFPPMITPPTSKEDLLHVFGNGSFKCKIADLGNACWTNRHFTEDVQTRPYRAPEVILGYKSYDTSIDVWSLACIIFELLTGDLLFTPRAGKNYSKDDDHLAQIMELLGRLPREMVLFGKHSSDYLTRSGDLRNIKTLKFWGLKDVLVEKYKHSLDEANNIASFLLPMLEYVPSKRSTAKDRLRHAWLKDIDVDNFESCFQ